MPDFHFMQVCAYLLKNDTVSGVAFVFRAIKKDMERKFHIFYVIREDCFHRISTISTPGCFFSSNLKKLSAGREAGCLMLLMVMITSFPSFPKEVTF